jgi:alpha-tubulin suppressor-like RCC1 family protein
LGDAVGQFGSTLPVQGLLLSGVKSVHAMNGTSVVLRTDGTVWAWGNNDYGVLGNGSTTSSKTPAQVSGLTGVTALATGMRHILTLKSDGTVWAWGDNAYNQLGDGTNVRRTRPVQVAGLTQVTAIAAGQSHSLALKSDGTVWAWGDNVMGCLGDGTTISRAVPFKVPGLSGVTSIAAGRAFSLAIRGTRELWGWGAGPLGDSISSYQTPTRTYQWASGTFSLFAGASHAVALDLTQGKAWTWGDLSSYGTCQTGQELYGRIPAELGLTGVEGVSVGDRYAHAFLTDGTVWGWGGGTRQKGNGQQTSGDCAPSKVLLP